MTSHAAAMASTDDRLEAVPDGEELSRLDQAIVGELKRMTARGAVTVYSRLVDLFRAGSAEALTHLRTALEASDLGAAHTICRKLRPSAAGIGALAFARQVGELESLCKEANACGAWHLLEVLQAAQPALIAALNSP